VDEQLNKFNFGTRWRLEVRFTALNLISMERAHGTHCMGGFMGPVAVLNTKERREILIFARNRHPSLSVYFVVDMCDIVT
jgi:hypothetical protein